MSMRNVVRRIVGPVAVAAVAAVAAGGFAAGSAAAGTVGPALAALARSASATPVAVWVTFADRAGSERDPAALARAEASLSPRARARRANRAHLAGVTAADLPVHAPYVHALTARGAVLRGTSRWLDAASVLAPPALAADLARLPFVQSVELVPLGRMSPDPGAFEPDPSPPASATPTGVEFAPGDTGFYGPTWKQLAMMQVPQVHASGNTGQGVLVCMLDSGFRTVHQAYSTLHVVAQHDFVWGDSIVDDQVPPDQAGQGSHGTLTLGEVAGVFPGVYSGVAFGCDVALAKTEYVPTETPVEMDNWQFGAEWADSLGADVISSSLGYSQFDSPYPSYTYADMNGQTTVVTRAASEAVRRGITVVSANGNEGATAWHFLIAPADADTLVACGAVDSNNVVASFSSRGPSSDGRIKPDVSAMGVHTRCISFTSPTGYGFASGTSLSTPLIAGVAALVLSAHPTWGPFEVREALRQTALNHATPDDNVGWGLVQAADAIAWVPSTTGVDPIVPGGAAMAMRAAPNPFRVALGTAVTLGPHAESTLDAFDLRGRRVARVYRGASGAPTTVRWNGRSDGGERLSAGVYWLKLAPVGKAASPPISPLRVVLLP
jgi:hypothetical protein